MFASNTTIRDETLSALRPAEAVDQTSAGLSPVALAPLGAQQMTPTMSCFAQTLCAIGVDTFKGALIVSAHAKSR
jgi:hypothetical protein